MRVEPGAWTYRDRTEAEVSRPEVMRTRTRADPNEENRADIWISRFLAPRTKAFPAVLTEGQPINSSIVTK